MIEIWKEFREAVIEHFNKSWSSYFAGQLLKYSLVIYCVLGIINLLSNEPFKIEGDDIFLHFFLSFFFAITKILDKIQDDIEK